VIAPLKSPYFKAVSEAHVNLDPTAFLSSLFIAVCPNAILGTALFMNEHLYLLSVMLVLWLVVLDLKQEAWWKLALAGIFLGFSDLSRGVFFLFPGALFVFYLAAGKSIQRTVLKTLLVLATTLMVVLPWTYRNYKVTGYPVPVGTTAGSGLYMMNSPPVADPYTTQLTSLDRDIPDWRSAHPNREVASYLVASQHAYEWIRSDFRRFMKLGAGKLVAFFGLNKTWTNYNNARGSTQFLLETWPMEASEQVLKYYFAFHFCWFLVGSTVLLRSYVFRDRVGMKSFILFTVLFILGMHFLFAGWPRYRYPLEPLVYMISAFTIVHFANQKKIKHDTRHPATVA